MPEHDSAKPLAGDWTAVPLTEVATVLLSNVDKKSRAGEPSVRLCNYLDVYQNESLTAAHPYMKATASQREIGRFSLQEGDVVVTKDSESPDDIGIPTFIKATGAEPLVCGYHLAIIRLQDHVAPFFLAKQLAQDRIRTYFAREARGSTRFGLPLASLRNTEVWLPPLPEQRRIAEILDTVDEAIRKTEEVIAKLEQIKKGLLHDLLTRGIDENGELRDPERHPEEFKDSELGRIPAPWQCTTLSTVGDWLSGGTPSKSNPSFWGGPIPWVSPKDMKAFRLTDTQDHVTREGAVVGSRLTPPGSILIVVRGMILAHTFPVCCVTREVTFNQDVKAIVPRSSIAKSFLAYWLVGHDHQLLSLVTESTHGTKRIDLRELTSVEIAVPPLTEQKAIAEILEALDIALEAERDRVGKLCLLKKGLMDDLLTGRVRVSVEAEEPV